MARADEAGVRSLPAKEPGNAATAVAVASEVMD